MKKTTFVALLILSFQCFADSLQSSLIDIESEWASIYYTMPAKKKVVAYPKLLDKVVQLSNRYPNRAEPLFWQAVIISTYADHQGAISALDSIHDARDLLMKAITINPRAMNGSAYVTLGTLYYMVPKWPIAFGDTQKAKEFLETALKINPDGIDSNYYYGEFLLANNEYDKAQAHFLKAAQAKSQGNPSYSDRRIKEDAQLALRKIKTQKVSQAKVIDSALESSQIK